MKTYIVHMDGDAFFAACELIARPHLWGKPVVVGRERGIVTALTYEAKTLGVKRGMPLFQLRQLFPKVTILGGHFNLYKEISKRTREILSRYPVLIENYSIDENFLEVTASSDEEVMRIARTMRDHIREKIGVTYSFGIAHTKTLAKVASKLEKPAGLTLLTDKNRIIDVLKNTPVENLWGIGRALSDKLLKSGVYNAYQFISLPPEYIARVFTKPTIHTYQELHGVLKIPLLRFTHDRKSMQVTRAFLKPTNNFSVIESELAKNIELGARDLRKADLVTNHISYYIQKKGHSKVWHEIQLANYTNDTFVILEAFSRILPCICNLGDFITSSGIYFVHTIPKKNIGVNLFGETIMDMNASLLGCIDTIQKKHGTNKLSTASAFSAIQSRFNEQSVRDNADDNPPVLPFVSMGYSA